MAKKEDVTIAQSLKDLLQDALGIQNKMNEASEAEKEINSEINKIKEKQIKLEEQIEERQRQQVALDEKIEELNRKKKEDQEIYNKLKELALGDEKELAEIEKARLQEANDLNEKINKLNEQKSKLTDRILSSEEKIERGLKNKNKLQKKQNKLLEEGTEEFQKQQAMTAAIDKTLGGLGKILPGSAGKFFKTMQGGYKKLQKFTKFLGKDGQGMKNWFEKSKGVQNIGKVLERGAKSGGKYAKQMGFLSNIFKKMPKLLGRLGPAILRFAASPWGLAVVAVMAVIAAYALLIAKLVQLGIEIDNYSKQIASATGYTNQFHDEILGMTSANIMSGVGFAESAKALGALAQGMSSFLPENEKANQYMATNVALLEKFGVSAQQSVQAMDHMERAMGLNKEQAADLAANVARMGKEVGITAVKAMNDFNKASARLSIYGADNIKVFKKLQAVSKATGMSIDSLTGSASKFDTFDGAAEQAAHLNAVLGTSIDHLQLMHMDDAERVIYIRDQVKARVGNFDSLNKFTKMHIAQSMNLKSVDEAQRMLNMSTKEYTDTLSGQKESAQVQEEMAEAAAKLVPLMDQLKLYAMNLLLAFEPLISIFAHGAKYMTEFIAFGAKLVRAALAFGSAFSFVAGPILAVGAALGGVAGLLNPLTLGIAAVTGAVTGMFWAWDSIKSLFSAVINPPFINWAFWMAEGMNFLLSPLRIVTNLVDNLATKFMKFFLILSGHGDQVNNLDAFSIEDLMTLDTDKIHSGLGKIKSAIAEIGEVDMSGVLMAKPDGTVLFGGEDLIDSISDGRLNITIDAPEQKQSIVNTIVKIGETELKKLIEGVTHETVGAA